MYKSGMGENGNVEAESLGGSDIEDWVEYEVPDESAYFDKENHLKRSLRHQPNHARAVRKKELLEELPEVTSR